MSSKRSAASHSNHDGPGKKVKRVKYSGISVRHIESEAHSDEEDPEAFSQAVEEQLEKKAPRTRLKLNEDDSSDSGSDDDDEDHEDDGKGPSKDEDDLFAEDDDDDDLKPRRKQKVSQVIAGVEGEENDPEHKDAFAAVKDPEGEQKEIPIEPFNMKAIMEEGDFNEDGVYVEKKDEDRRHDTWLQGVSASDIRKAAEAHAKQMEAAERQQQARRPTSKEKMDMLKELMTYMESRETVRQTIQRLGASIKRKLLGKNKQKNVQPDLSTEEVKRRRAAIERVTEIADILMNAGNVDIYDDVYEELLHDLNEKPERQAAKPSQSSSKQTSVALLMSSDAWRYKWAEDGEVFGPFSAQDMVAWYRQDYFKGVPMWLQAGSADGSRFEKHLLE